MSPKSRQQMRLRLERMEAKQSLRSEQVRRRRRDNLAAGIAIALVVAIALVLQLTTFRTNPTAAQMAAIEQSMQVPSDEPSEEPSNKPSASTSAASAPLSDEASAPPATSVSNGANIPDPSLAAGKAFTGTIETNFGPIEVRLDGGKAPQAVSVFKFLTGRGYFEGRTCHRLIDSPSLSVLQCGSENGGGASDPDFAWGPVENAPEDGKYPAGSIAVARGSGEYSHGKQFFIVYEDSTISPSSGGYTIMGQVTDGLDVVKEIAANGLKSSGTSSTDGAPKDPVTTDSFTLN